VIKVIDTFVGYAAEYRYTKQNGDRVAITTYGNNKKEALDNMKVNLKQRGIKK